MSRTIEVEPEAPATDLQPQERVQRERRFVYNGDPGGGSAEFLTRGNKPLKRRRKSPFKIVTLIAAISFLIVFYVWNKITVNRLAAEVDALENRLGKLSSINKDLGGTIDKKSSLDRITDLAKKRLGMIESPEQPTYFEVENYEPRPAEDGR
jgi:cell division protein FtsL